jgi:hypothetical protein
MRSRFLLPIVLLLCATAAFADQTTAVNIPFSFKSHGALFPASQYVVRLSEDRHHLTITSKETGKSMFLLVGPVSVDHYAPLVSLRFEEAGGSHELRSIRIGEYQYQH